MTGARVDRATRVAAADALRGEGLTGTEIAKRLGISRSHAYELLNDPDGSCAAARKDKRTGVCVDCAAETRNGGGVPPKRCRACALEASRASRVWTHELIVERIREWDRRFGRPPTATEWSVGVAASRGYADALAVRRSEPGYWPALSLVQRRFGSWQAAILAAGLQITRPGRGRERLRELDAPA